MKQEQKLRNSKKRNNPRCNYRFKLHLLYSVSTARNLSQPSLSMFPIPPAAKHNMHTVKLQLHARSRSQLE